MSRPRLVFGGLVAFYLMSIVAGAATWTAHASASAPGQVPQETTDMPGIAVTSGGTMFINDTQKVIVYGPDGRYVRTFLAGFAITSIGCPGTEELVVLGPHDGKILHVFDAQGKPVASFGDTFMPPKKFESMKEMPMFGAPLRFNCAKDGRIFVLNPLKYEVSVFKDRKLEGVIEGRNDAFKPVRKTDFGFASTAADIHRQTANFRSSVARTLSSLLALVTPINTAELLKCIFDCLVVYKSPYSPVRESRN